MQVSKFDATRLVRTESAYFQGQVTLRDYIAEGVKEYEYLATLDNRTSKQCRNKDGKIFLVSDITVGVNYPPLHPFCRSTTIPVLEDTKDSENLKEIRSARDYKNNSPYKSNVKNYKEYYKEQIQKHGKEEIEKIDEIIENEDKNNYEDIADVLEYLKTNVHINLYAQVKEKKYYIDRGDAFYNTTKEEKEVAELLSKYKGIDISLNPEINSKYKMKSPDYIVNGKEKWDYKRIEGKSNNAVDNAINKKKEQAEIFVFRIDKKSTLSEEEITNQFKKVFKNKKRNWVKGLLLINENKILNWFKRK